MADTVKKKVLNMVLAIDNFWQSKLFDIKIDESKTTVHTEMRFNPETQLDEEVEVVTKTGTIFDVIIDRVDGKFFKMILSRALGYIFPMFFEVLNQKNNLAGSICVCLREKNNQEYVVVEKVKYENWRHQAVIAPRISRASYSNPSGSPIPVGTKEEDILFKSCNLELNNLRLAGEVQSLIIRQDYNAPLLTDKGQELMLLDDFMNTSNDAPGKAMLSSYFRKQNNRLKRDNARLKSVLKRLQAQTG